MSPEDRMRQALDEARRAAARDEVPVGAVLVGPDGQVWGRGHDARMESHDPTAHAEILALREAARHQGDWRLDGCDLFVTLEPCPMCAGAILMARVRRLYYGAPSPKSGAVESLCRLLDTEGFNHSVEVHGGLLAEECGDLLRKYFHHRRGGSVPEGSSEGG